MDHGSLPHQRSSQRREYLPTYFFSNSPVKWRLTKVVLPTPPSPTRMSLNSGASDCNWGGMLSVGVTRSGSRVSSYHADLKLLAGEALSLFRESTGPLSARAGLVWFITGDANAATCA